MFQLKKIPRTTSSRRGASVDRVVQNQNVILEENHMQIVYPDDMTTVGAGVINEGSIKNGKKGNGDMDDEVSVNDRENENLDEGEIMNMIQDNYDPYAYGFWQEDVDNDESYLKRLYKNGEFYEDVKWVVEKSSPTRFTATCLNLNCQWRLHSSRLLDGKTWAIKSIRNDEHICHGLDNKTPLVNVEWAAEKLMDYIRANNDISGNTLNDYLRQRYGVQMAKSSLYNMRSYALKSINGGHDESYSFLPKYIEIGIEVVLTVVWPKAGRRYCCKHLAKNWKGEFNEPLMYSLL
ncbi:hypothetical protein RDABS01_014807 [Bienertia sinuspersici]